MTRTGQLDPSTAHRVDLESEFGPIAGLRTGDGPDVLLLPGFTGSKEDFTPLLDPLAEAGFRVTAIDLPGQFESPGPDVASWYTPHNLAKIVLRTAGQCREPLHLVGHSFGGLVARAAVLADSAPFADLVLMSSGPAEIGGIRRQRVDELEPMLADGLASVYDAMQAALMTEPNYAPPPADLADFLRRRFLAGNPAMLAGMGRSLRTEPDLVDQLAATGLPTLVLFGEDDDAWPPQVQAQMAQRLGAQAVEIPGAAHSPAVENTAATAKALVDFWRR